MEKKRGGVFFVLLAGILWGLLGIFVRVLNTYGLAAMQIVFMRALVASAALALFLFFYDRTAFAIRLKDLWCFLGTGIASIVFFNFCYFLAVSMMSLAAASVLLYTAPVFVMLLSFAIFREPLTVRKWAAIACTFAGCLLVTGIVGSGASLSAGGILVGLGAGLGYALYSIFGRFALNRGYSSLTITFYTFMIAAVAAAFLSLAGAAVSGTVSAVAGSGAAAEVGLSSLAAALGGGLHPIFSAIAVGGAPVVAAMLALGILSTVLPFLSYTVGLQRMESSFASVVASIEPVTATLVGLVLYHESLTPLTILGIALVLFGIALVNLAPGAK